MDKKNLEKFMGVLEASNWDMGVIANSIIKLVENDMGGTPKKKKEESYETVIVTLGASEIKIIKEHIANNTKETKKAYEKVLRSLGEVPRNAIKKKVEGILKNG